MLHAYPADIVVFGHTHRAVIERLDGRLAVNPGAAGPQRFNLKPSVARLTIAENGPQRRSSGCEISRLLVACASPESVAYGGEQ